MAEEVASNDERLISPAALLGITAVSSSGLTTAGLTGGTTGAIAAGAVGAAALGVAAVALRRRRDSRLGLKKPDRDRPGVESSGHKTKGGLFGRSRSGGPGGRGLVGGAGRKRPGAGGADGSPKRKRGAGLLGATRHIAGRGAAAAKNAAAKAGLLGGKRKAGRNDTGRGKGAGGGLLGRNKGKDGRSKGTGAGHGSGSGSAPPKHGSSKNGGGLAGRLARGLARGAVGLLGGRGKDKSGDVGGKKDKDKTKGKKGPGLIGGEKTRDDRRGDKKRDRDEVADRRDDHDTKRPTLAAEKGERGITERVHEGTNMPNPFAGRQEAISGAPPLEIERANDLIDYVKHAPDHAEVQANRWKAEARNITEQIDVAPEFAEALHDFAGAQLQQVEKVREFGVVFNRAHAERLEKLKRADPREEKWDISRNRA